MQNLQMFPSRSIFSESRSGAKNFRLRTRLVSVITAAHLLNSTAIRTAWCFCCCELPCRSFECAFSVYGSVDCKQI